MKRKRRRPQLVVACLSEFDRSDDRSESLLQQFFFILSILLHSYSRYTMSDPAKRPRIEVVRKNKKRESLFILLTVVCSAQFRYLTSSVGSIDYKCSVQCIFIFCTEPFFTVFTIPQPKFKTACNFPPPSPSLQKQQPQQQPTSSSPIPPVAEIAANFEALRKRWLTPLGAGDRQRPLRAVDYDDAVDVLLSGPGGKFKQQGSLSSLVDVLVGLWEDDLVD